MLSWGSPVMVMKISAGVKDVQQDLSGGIDGG